MIFDLFIFQLDPGKQRVCLFASCANTWIKSGMTQLRFLIFFHASLCAEPMGVYMKKRVQSFKFSVQSCVIAKEPKRLRQSPYRQTAAVAWSSFAVTTFPDFHVSLCPKCMRVCIKKKFCDLRSVYISTGSRII